MSQQFDQTLKHLEFSRRFSLFFGDAHPVRTGLPTATRGQALVPGDYLTNRALRNAAGTVADLLGADPARCCTSASNSLDAGISKPPPIDRKTNGGIPHRTTGL